MFSFLGRKKRSRTEIIDLLSSNGICLRDGQTFIPSEDADVEMILCEFGRVEWLDKDFTRSQAFSDDVWHFDTEAIEDRGAYVEIARNLARLANGALENASFFDFVDIEGEVAWFEIEFNGARERITLKVDDDWVDPRFFHWFNEQLEKTGSNRRVAAHGLGQDCLIICKAPSEIAKLNRALGLKFSIE